MGNLELISRFLVTATMICGGLVMYPIGWDNREVRESCGKGANVYNLGEYPRPRSIVFEALQERDAGIAGCEPRAGT